MGETVEAVFKRASRLPSRAEIMDDVNALMCKAQTLAYAEETTRGLDPVLVCLMDFLSLFGASIATNDKESFAFLAIVMDETERFLAPSLLRKGKTFLKKGD